MENLTEQEWFKRANEYADTLNYATSGNFEDYRGFYENDYSPEEAIREDISNCD